MEADISMAKFLFLKALKKNQTNFIFVVFYFDCTFPEMCDAITHASYIYNIYYISYSVYEHSHPVYKMLRSISNRYQLIYERSVVSWCAFFKDFLAAGF